MNYFGDFNTIPFELELKCSERFRYEEKSNLLFRKSYTPGKEIITENIIAKCDRVPYVDGNEVLEVAGKLREIISANYPYFTVHSSTTFSGIIGGNKEGSHITAWTTPKHFRQVFGDNLKSGLSLLLGQFPIPMEINRKWYQVGEFFIPEDMQEYVKGVYLGRYATGSFNEADFFKPKEAKY